MFAFVALKLATKSNIPDPQEIIDTLDDIRKEYLPKRVSRPLQKEAKKKFKECARDLSSLLPKVSNSSLFEVDQFWYSDEKNFVDVSGTKMCSEETMTCLIENCFATYHNLYVNYAGLYGRVVDMAYLQLIEHSSTILIRRINETPSTSNSGNVLRQLVFSFVITLIKHRWQNKLHAVRALKILLVASDKHSELVLEQIYKFRREAMALFLWMSNMLVIPESKSIKANQMTSWLSKQTRAVLQKLDLGKMKFLNPKPGRFENYNNDATVEYIRKYYPLKTEHFNAEFISSFWGLIGSFRYCQIPFCFEILAAYFLTAKTEDEKITRIKNFFEGFELYDKRRSKRLTRTETPMRLIFDPFLSCIEFIYEATRNCQQSHLKLLEKHYASFVDQPYLTIGSKCSSYLQFRNKTSQLMDQYFTISDYTPVYEPSFTLDKIFYFGDFVRIIQVMDAMHSAYLIYDEIFEPKGDDSTFITNEFRPFPSPFKRIMSDFLRNPSMRGHTLWWFQYLLKKCPFLFLSYDHESHMENLIKMLKGIKISKADEESLYFAVNNKSYTMRRSVSYPMYSTYVIGANVTDEQDSGSSDDSDADDQPTSN